MIRFILSLLVFIFIYFFSNSNNIAWANNDTSFESVKQVTKLGCYGINVTNLTKNLSCTNNNPNDCNVEKGDKLKLSINTDKANLVNEYNFLIFEEFVDGRVIANSKGVLTRGEEMYINEYIFTVSDYNDLIRLEVKGSIYNIPYFINSSNQCNVIFKFPVSGKKIFNLDVPSCVDTELIVNNKACKGKNCFVKELSNITLTTEYTRKPYDNYVLIEYIFTDGTSFLRSWLYSSREEKNKTTFNYVHDDDSNNVFTLFNVKLSELKLYTFLVDKLDDNDNYIQISDYLRCMRSIKISDYQEANNLSDEDKILVINLNNNIDGKFGKFKKINDKEFFINLDVKNVSDFDISLNDFDLFINYDSNSLKLNKVIWKKANDELEFSNLNTNNIKDLISNTNFSILKPSESYSIYYYFETNNLKKTNYCFDLISEKYSQNFNHCVDLSNNKDYVFWYLLVIVFVFISILLGVVFLFIYRNKIKSFVQNIIQKQKS